MPRIPIGEAQPGQKLVRPAVTRTGMVMVQPGTELTEAIIQRLQNLGIDSISVEGRVAGDAKPLDEALRELDERFAGHEQHAWMMQLKAIVARQLRDNASAGEEPAADDV
jgi:hypothetical protein